MFNNFRLVNFNPGPRMTAAFGFAQIVLDTEVIKDSNFYVPTDQFFLQRSALLVSDIGQGSVKWQTPYARRLYYNPQFNFSKDKNPNARGLWFEAAKAEKAAVWKNIAQAAVDQHMGGNS